MSNILYDFVEGFILSVMDEVRIKMPRRIRKRREKKVAKPQHDEMISYCKADVDATLEMYKWCPNTQP